MIRITSNLPVNPAITYESRSLRNKNIPVNVSVAYIIRTGLIQGLLSIYRYIVKAVLDYK